MALVFLRDLLLPAKTSVSLGYVEFSPSLGLNSSLLSSLGAMVFSLTGSRVGNLVKNSELTLLLDPMLNLYLLFDLPLTQICIALFLRFGRSWSFERLCGLALAQSWLSDRFLSDFSFVHTLAFGILGRQFWLLLTLR